MSTTQMKSGFISNDGAQIYYETAGAGSPFIMVVKLPSAQKVMIEDAAHLPNMDQPNEFRETVASFLKDFHAKEKI